LEPFKVGFCMLATATSMPLERSAMVKKFPSNPANPERICWGCDLYCPANSMRCGNGSDRTQHPVELFGEGWEDWGKDASEKPAVPPKAEEA